MAFKKEILIVNVAILELELEIGNFREIIVQNFLGHLVKEFEKLSLPVMFAPA